MKWPKVFHRIWLDEPERPEFAGWRDRLAELHPDWEIRTWQDSSEFTWLRNKDLFYRYLETDPFGRVPDILRYELLWKYGGVYIDTDFEPLRPLDPLLEDPRPFAAWENDRTMCTALLASPPKHPAIGELIEGLPAQCAATEDKTPNYATGPEYATAHWRRRNDVRRLPPWTFYPVGWWERHLLGDPANYHPDTFAVHHWSKGWGEDKQLQKADVNGKTVILVPLRLADPQRERVWAFVREHLEQLGWPIFVADSDSVEWNRSKAINRAAEQAGDWECALITDADTIVDAAAMRKAATRATATGSVLVPWKLRWKLSEAGTVRRMGIPPRSHWTQTHRDLDHLDRTPARLPVVHRGGPVMVPRRAWDVIGGFDEQFIGWGHEDVAFRIAAQTLAPGGLQEVAGTIWHLWHKQETPSEANDARKFMYKQAAGDAEALRALNPPKKTLIEVQL